MTNKKFNLYCIIVISFLIVKLLTISIVTNAQTKEDDLTIIKQLYLNGMYEAVIQKSKEIKGDDLSEVKGYAIMSAVKLRKPNCEGLISEYEGKYPYSLMLIRIKLVQADLYFSDKDYINSYKHFSQIIPTALNIRELDEYYFKKGYSAMQSNLPSEALACFQKIYNNAETSIGRSAMYYSGYIHYSNRNFAEAITFFNKVLSDNRYSNRAKTQILESKLMLGDFDYVIENGENFYDSVQDNSKPKIARMISQAYYAKEMPKKAKYYFDLYSLGEGDLSYNDIFYSGVVSYSIGEYISAIDSFTKVASTNDSLGQSAYYHLGESYIKVKNKRSAQEAFKQASSCSYDKLIQEDAFFNYAKLSFDLDKNINPFNNYLETFSCSKDKKEEIYNYMATSFLLNKEYENAIKAYKKIDYSKPEIINNLRKATFLRGMELIENGSYNMASKYMNKTIEYSQNNDGINNLAKFWLAECYYRGNSFREAANILENLENVSSVKKYQEYPLIFFNLGYCYLKTEAYQKAINKFEKYNKLANYSHNNKINESKTRIADCYFYLRNFEKAAELYENLAISDNYKNLYTALQASISYGLISKNDKKIALLYEITRNNSSNSPQYSNALYELGRTLVQSSKEDEAITIFNKLISSSDSSYYYKAILELGMISMNAKEYDNALSYYKKIVENSPGSEETQSALAGIENIYQILDKTDEFITYIDNLGITDIKTLGDKEKMIFDAAEQAFMNNNYPSAIKNLNMYISRYPDGAKIQQAYFYLGECYNKLEKFEQAADSYFKVMLKGEGAFSELATLKYGEISYSLEKYDEAVKAFETLGQIAKLDNNKNEALIGKMRSYYKLNSYQDAINCSEEVINNIDNKVYQQEAKYILSKSYLALGKHQDAITNLKALAADTKTEYGAEANYILILDAFTSGDFKSVEKLTFNFSDSKTPQLYWLAKSFIVLGDAYVEQDNIEQAKATYRSIQQNYKPKNQDDILSTIKIRLDNIDKREE